MAGVGHEDLREFGRTGTGKESFPTMYIITTMTCSCTHVGA